MAATSRPPVPSRLQGTGVLLRTVQKGDETTFPNLGDTCLIHYDSFLEDGTKIDSSRRVRDLPLEFKVGGGHLVPGLDAAVPKLSLGSTTEVTIPPLYAYGSAGCPPHVPPEETLVYRIKMLRIER